MVFRVSNLGHGGPCAMHIFPCSNTSTSTQKILLDQLISWIMWVICSECRAWGPTGPELETTAIEHSRLCDNKLPLFFCLNTKWAQSADWNVFGMECKASKSISRSTDQAEDVLQHDHLQTLTLDHTYLLFILGIVQMIDTGMFVFVCFVRKAGSWWCEAVLRLSRSLHLCLLIGWAEKHTA